MLIFNYCQKKLIQLRVVSQNQNYKVKLTNKKKLVFKSKLNKSSCQSDANCWFYTS